MRTNFIIAILAVMFANGLVFSQTGPPMVITRLEISPKGSFNLVIQNNYTEPMTAYAYEYSFFSGGHRVTAVGIKDLFFGSHQEPIASGQSVDVGLDSRSMDVKDSFRCAVFADGATFGDADWIARMLRQRQFGFEEASNVENKLRRAITEGKEIDSLIDQLTSDEAERKASAQNDVDHLQMINSILGMTIEVLKRNREEKDTVQFQFKRMRDIRRKLDHSLPKLTKDDDQNSEDDSKPPESDDACD